jgi:hypothetical protein
MTACPTRRRARSNTPTRRSPAGRTAQEKCLYTDRDSHVFKLAEDSQVFKLAEDPQVFKLAEDLQLFKLMKTSRF